MSVNLHHLHLLLSHVPTEGTTVALGVLLLGVVKQNDGLKRASLALFFAIALLSLPTYITGHSAAKALTDRPNVSRSVVEQHQSAALLALTCMGVTGVVAWFGLWQARRPSLARRRSEALVLLFAVVTIVLMANAANIGGRIGHSEIVAPGQAPGGALAPDALKTENISKYQFEHRFAWPMLESLHFIGLCLLFGVVLLGTLRILGLMRNAPLVDVHRFLPWGLWGFVINAVTGMMFFTGAPGQYIENPAFHLKVLLMLLAGVNVLYLTLCDGVWRLGPGDSAPMSAKLAAASQLLLWVGVIYFGRMLPYIGTAF